ncbi:MAG: rod shape-determining protein MreD [Gammaproteobacteria bacterium]|nr:rod shape-determining protein MreD [Gammaproteobacteria bacterium]
MSVHTRGRLILFGTFAVAILLNILPGPAWAEPFIPDWVALVLIYWCMAAPQRISVGTGWALGLFLDVLYGALLGQHALAKAVIAFITVRLHPQLRMFPRWQQAVSVLVLLAINQLLVLWIRGAIGTDPGTVFYWTPSVVGMLIWPWLFVILRDLRRRGRVA